MSTTSSGFQRSVTTRPPRVGDLGLQRRAPDEVVVELHRALPAAPRRACAGARGMSAGSTLPETLNGGRNPPASTNSR